MRISIITVNYNDAKGLERTINSVIAQIFTDKEFIVVDGASKDGSIDVINQYKDYISKSISEPDSGIYNGMNKGIRLATGDYCIFMNSGDYFYSNKVLEVANNYLETGEDIYNGNALYVKDGRIIEWYRKGNKELSTLDLFKSSICHQATFIKTSLLKEIMYDESLKMVADWKFWLEAIHYRHASYAPINVDVCCFDTGGITTTKQELGLKERLLVLESFFTETEMETYDALARKKNLWKSLKEGLGHRFWLYYARLFMKKHIQYY